MINPTASITYGGKPLQVLNDLISKRQKWLNETYKQSVAATAITALKSIRAITETHVGKNNITISDKDVTITQRNDIHPSFTGKARHRCFRAGPSYAKHAARIDLGNRCVQLVPPSAKEWQNAQVWSVKLTPARLERWPNHPPQFYVVATSYDTVINYLKKRFGRIAANQAGLARAVLGATMARLSTYPPASEKAAAHVAKLVNKFAVVQQRDSGESYSVHVESNLVYALDAVKGGSSGVQNALKSAANKIAGIIKHKAGASLDEDLATPFPEVKKR